MKDELKTKTKWKLSIGCWLLGINPAEMGVMKQRLEAQKRMGVRMRVFNLIDRAGYVTGEELTYEERVAAERLAEKRLLHRRVGPFGGNDDVAIFTRARAFVLVRVVTDEPAKEDQQ